MICLKCIEPDEEKEGYSKPILVIGGSYLNAKERIKEYSRYFSVVVIDEYMTRTCEYFFNERLRPEKHIG